MYTTSVGTWAALAAWWTVGLFSQVLAGGLIALSRHPATEVSSAHDTFARRRLLIHSGAAIGAAGQPVAHGYSGGEYRADGPSGVATLYRSVSTPDRKPSVQ